MSLDEIVRIHSISRRLRKVQLAATSDADLLDIWEEFFKGQNGLQKRFYALYEMTNERPPIHGS
jgi:hypothetical protein